MIMCYIIATLQQQISSESQSASSATSEPLTTSDRDSVYFRFYGAAMASILHAHYKRDTCKPSQRDSIKRQIAVIRAIKVSDDSKHDQVPAELLYRDRGFMY